MRFREFWSRHRNLPAISHIFPQVCAILRNFSQLDLALPDRNPPPPPTHTHTLVEEWITHVMCPTFCGIVHVVTVLVRIHGNVTEELLFVLILLLCNRVPSSYGSAFNICLPRGGCRLMRPPSVRAPDPLV